MSADPWGRTHPAYGGSVCLAREALLLQHPHHLAERLVRRPVHERHAQQLHNRTKKESGVNCQE
jgi:hypothetical protein